MFRVYKITFPNDKVYIGYTGKTITKRLDEHISTAKRYNYPISKALRKFNFNVRIEEIDRTEKLDKVKELEINYIKQYKSYIKNNKGYNATLGGDGNNGYIPSKKTLKKLSEKLKGRPGNSGSFKKGQIPWNKETKGVMKPNITSFKKNDDRFKELFKKMKGRKPWSTGKKFNDEYRRKLALSHGAKEFKVYLKENEKYVGTWLNQSKCAEELNICSKKINACLKAKQKQHKGYVFRYVNKQ